MGKENEADAMVSQCHTGDCQNSASLVIGISCISAKGHLPRYLVLYAQAASRLQNLAFKTLFSLALLSISKVE